PNDAQAPCTVSVGGWHHSDGASKEFEASVDLGAGRAAGSIEVPTPFSLDEVTVASHGGKTLRYQILAGPLDPVAARLRELEGGLRRKINLFVDDDTRDPGDQIAVHYIPGREHSFRPEHYSPE